MTMRVHRRRYREESYNPRANGQVERFNKVLGNGLAKFTNTAKHSSTGETPFFLMFGVEPRIGIEELLKINVEEKFDIRKWKEEGIP